SDLFFSETELAPGDVLAVLERDGVRLAFDFDEDAQIGQQRPRHEQRDLVRRLELRLRRVRRRGVLEETALDPERQAVDQGLEGPVVLQTPHQAIRARSAWQLKAHQVE